MVSEEECFSRVDGAAQLLGAGAEGEGAVFRTTAVDISSLGHRSVSTERAL